MISLINYFLFLKYFRYDIIPVGLMKYKIMADAVVNIAENLASINSQIATAVKARSLVSIILLKKH